MTLVGSYEAKTRLPQLLARVMRGEKIVITKHGRPVAMLVPSPPKRAKDVKQVVKEMLSLRDTEGPTLGGAATIRELIDEGRPGCTREQSHSPQPAHSPGSTGSLSRARTPKTRS
jgi:prevent-host-death family protein